ncbi:hypothetical protein 2.15 [Burkholderia phage Bups phi1]|nr:hypothetical protein 2.15 [Burkholderia phage Bups phi1]
MYSSLAPVPEDFQLPSADA